MFFSFHPQLIGQILNLSENDVVHDDVNLVCCLYLHLFFMLMILKLSGLPDFNKRWINFILLKLIQSWRTEESTYDFSFWTTSHCSMFLGIFY